MNIEKTGLRYERLLILAAPITLACLFLLFIATATELDDDKKAVSCQLSSAQAMEAESAPLTAAWTLEQGKKLPFYSSKYHSELVRTFIYANLASSCYEVAKKSADEDFWLSPTVLIQKFKTRAEEIKSKIEHRPINAFGVEVPEHATVGLGGTNVKIRIMTFAQLIMIALAPIMVLWLRSLYNTRYQETLYISHTTSINALFPHSLNLYLVGIFPPLRKRSLATYFMMQILPYTPTLFRLIMLFVYIGPPTIAYCWSLYLLSEYSHFLVSWAIVILVGSIAFLNFTLELMPWHCGKQFKDQPTRPAQ